MEFSIIHKNEVMSLDRVGKCNFKVKRNIILYTLTQMWDIREQCRELDKTDT